MCYLLIHHNNVIYHQRSYFFLIHIQIMWIVIHLYGQNTNMMFSKPLRVENRLGYFSVTVSSGIDKTLVLHYMVSQNKPLFSFLIYLSAMKMPMKNCLESEQNAGWHGLKAEQCKLVVVFLFFCFLFFVSSPYRFRVDILTIIKTHC